MEDFDDAVEAGWRRFTVDLGDRLATMEPGDSYVLNLGFLCDDGLARDHPPFVVFTTHGTTRVRGSVCNATTVEDAILAESGWRPRGRFPRTMEVTRRRADRLARCAVEVVRDVFSVPDASFVDGTPAAVPPTPVSGRPDGPEALQHMVDAAVADISGQPAEKDEDGDIPLPTAVPSWLRVSQDEAALEVFCTRITDGEAVTAEMLFVVAERWPGVALTVREGALVARMRVEAADFSPTNLRSELARWFTFLDDGADEIRSALTEIAERDGTPPTPDEPTTDAPSSLIRTADVTTTTGRMVTLPPALEALLLLTSTTSRTLRPEEVAAVMDRDRDTILRSHRVCIGQRDEWDTAADAAADRDDVEEAHACLVESWRWGDVAASLRHALRVVLIDRRRTSPRPPETRRGKRPPHLSDPRDRR
ncbi:TY-Chap domain-containing protein [Williamsia sp. SKLECPSW1]